MHTYILYIFKYSYIIFNGCSTRFTTQHPKSKSNSRQCMLQLKKCQECLDTSGLSENNAPPQSGLSSYVHILFKHGWLENHLSKEALIGKSPISGSFCSQPFLIPRGYVYKRKSYGCNHIYNNKCFFVYIVYIYI